MNYEIHITCLTSQKEAAAKVAKKLHWKTSEIERDPILGNDTYFYLTKYAATYDDAMLFLRHTVDDKLFVNGIAVLREKIEHIVHDRRYVS